MLQGLVVLFKMLIWLAERVMSASDPVIFVPIKRTQAIPLAAFNH